MSPRSPDTCILSSATMTRSFSITARASAIRLLRVSTTAALRVRSSVSWRAVILQRRQHGLGVPAAGSRNSRQAKAQAMIGGDTDTRSEPDRPARPERGNHRQDGPRDQYDFRCPAQVVGFACRLANVGEVTLVTLCLRMIETRDFGASAGRV